MDEELPIYLFLSQLVRSLFIIVLFIGVSVITLNSEQNTPGPAVSKTVVVKITLPPSFPPRIADTEQINRSTPARAKIRGHSFYPIILQAANRYQIDPALVNAIIMAESGYNPKAVSKRGAQGLMQLMPQTAQALGVTDSFNPEQNIDGGVRHFKWLVTQFNGDIELALAAYNAGSRKVKHYQGVPPFRATQLYIEKVFKYYQIYKDRAAV